MKKRNLFILLVVLACGCASSEANLQRESARVIGNGTSPEKVTVLDIDRGISDVKWVAKTPGDSFNCSADDMLRRVYCAKQSSISLRKKP